MLVDNKKKPTRSLFGTIKKNKAATSAKPKAPTAPTVSSETKDTDLTPSPLVAGMDLSSMADAAPVPGSLDPTLTNPVSDPATPIVDPNVPLDEPKASNDDVPLASTGTDTPVQEEAKPLSRIQKILAERGHKPTKVSSFAAERAKRLGKPLAGSISMEELKAQRTKELFNKNN